LNKIVNEESQELDHGIPRPADADRRVEPLPWESPKSTSEDAYAADRVRQIMENPSYRRADKDSDFLNTAETRGSRLDLDYSKANSLLTKHGVEHTIAVFGGTRISEPAAARRAENAAKTAVKKNPGDFALERQLQVARRVLAKSRYYEIARELGSIVGASGLGPADCRVTLMTGGGPGIMEAANRGAFDVGARSIGLNISLPQEQYPNPYVTPELCFTFRYFAIRKLHIILRARALVAFPGGFGTLDELFETLTLIQTRKIKPLPVILVGEEFWRGVFDADFLVDEGVIDQEDRDLFWFSDSAQATWDGICKWHRDAGASLLEDDN
jgi:uncharacterized protein (TIGR00730 family)